MNKTVYIITFAGSVNYGALLQGYALYRTVKKQGYPCKIIDYNRNLHHRNYLLPGFDKASVKGKCRILMTITDRFILHNKFNSFVRRHEELTLPFNGSNALKNQLWDTNDIYLVGSDQVFNLAVTEGNYHYYLDFVESQNKIAYAPSFGTTIIPEQYKVRAAELLKKFRKITVREESGTRLIKGLIGKSAQPVMDPCFLLSEDEWMTVFKKPREKGYVLLFPFRKDSTCIERAKRYAHDKKLELINIAYMVSKVEGARNIKCLSPEAWGGYISNAEKVFTDSFHGMVFSIIFQKNVCVSLDRVGKEFSRNSRILDLLNRLGIESIPEENSIEIEYQRIEFALKQQIRLSEHILSDMLQTIGGGDLGS